MTFLEMFKKNSRTQKMTLLHIWNDQYFFALLFLLNEGPSVSWHNIIVVQECFCVTFWWQSIKPVWVKLKIKQNQNNNFAPTTNQALTAMTLIFFWVQSLCCSAVFDVIFAAALLAISPKLLPCCITIGNRQYAIGSITCNFLQNFFHAASQSD